MPAIVSILIVVVGTALVVFLFGVLPEINMENFIDRANHIRIGMTKEEVHKLLKKKPYKHDSQIDYSTGRIIYEYEVYRKWAQSSDCNTYKQTIKTMEVEFKVYYEKGRVIGVEQI